MRCPYLTQMCSGGLCNASMSGMVPSAFEKLMYCTTEDHYRCPVLLARFLRGGKTKGLPGAVVNGR